MNYTTQPFRNEYLWESECFRRKPQKVRSGNGCWCVQCVLRAWWEFKGLFAETFYDDFETFSRCLSKGMLHIHQMGILRKANNERNSWEIFSNFCVFLYYFSLNVFRAFISMRWLFNFFYFYFSILKASRELFWILSAFNAKLFCLWEKIKAWNIAKRNM